MKAYELAIEVLEGKWGSGDERKKKLEKAGYNYDEVQHMVNVIYVALDVLDGKYGKDDARKKAIEKDGYSYDEVQPVVNDVWTARQAVVDKMNAWCEKIAADNRYHYNKWMGNEPQSKLCPICTKLDYNKDKKHFGWNCIGFGAAVWHHGGNLGNICNCGWISGPHGNADKIITMSDAEALAFCQKHTGVNDIEVIVNKNGIPKTKWQPGDICLRFSGDVFNHVFYFMGNEKIADSCGSSGNIPNDNQIAIRSYKGYTTKVIIRYRGWLKGYKPEKKYTGQLPTYHIQKSNQEVINDTIKWAKLIANNNKFHYGYTNKNVKPWYPNAHHNGCYFCNTNTNKGGRSKAGIVDYKLTYCCNPFVHAAWAHGGCIPKALEICQKGSSWDFHKGAGYDASKLFDNLGHPKKSALKPGDVLCRDTHVALYIGNNKIVEAGGGDDNVRNSTAWNNSIRIRTLTDKNYANFKRVHRFNSKVDADLFIRFGEISERVKDLQAYLNYFGNYGLDEDGIYFEKTLAAVKDFQLKKFGKGEDDGIVGPKTIAAMTD